MIKKLSNRQIFASYGEDRCAVARSFYTYIRHAGARCSQGVRRKTFAKASPSGANKWNVTRHALPPAAPARKFIVMPLEGRELTESLIKEISREKNKNRQRAEERVAEQIHRREKDIPGSVANSAPLALDFLRRYQR